MSIRISLNNKLPGLQYTETKEIVLRDTAHALTRMFTENLRDRWATIFNRCGHEACPDCRWEYQIFG
jgi:hypothetical protein